MSWPLSHEFNEAIQNPKVAFADPDLRDAEVVVGATGLPLPRSGNFADVYQMRGANGRDWAVKCFTRPVVGLAERYAKVSEALGRANLPFAVGFKFLSEGIRVGGAWRPVVVMEWVEGRLLNQVAREAVEKPNTLNTLGQMWVKLCKRLREAGLAHADLQHGNVLLVPGARAGAYGLKLIDYDGVWVPALANTPSGESGHPSFQHPARAATRAYSPDVDRFPHLVVATALRGLSVAGGALWEKYDNGDNLLFTEDDYKKPSGSKAMRELWQLEHSAVQALVGRLAIACGKPIPQTPWLDQFAPDGEPAPLDEPTRREAAAALGIALPVPVALPPEPKPVAEPIPLPAANPFVGVEEDEIDVELVEGPAPKSKKKEPAKPKRAAKPYKSKKSGVSALVLVGGALGALLLAGGLIAVLVSGGSKPKPDETVQNKEDPPPVVPPKKGPVEPVVPKPKDNTPAVTPNKGPDNTPAASGPWTFKERWKQSLPDDWKQIHGLRLGTDARTGQVNAGDGKLVVFDTTTGEPLKNPPDVAGIMYGVHVLDGGHVAKTWQVAGGPLPVWDARAGKEAAALARVIEGPVHVEVSPNGRYMAAWLGHGQGKTALKLTDTSTGKVVVETPWDRGAVRFTADSSRALIADGVGQCRWVKLPSGEADGEWNLEGNTERIGVVAVSGDGARLVLTGSRLGLSLVDGRTGRAVRRLDGQVGQAGFSHDGKLLLKRAGQSSEVELVAADTGDVVLRIPLAGMGNLVDLGLASDLSAAFVVASVGARFELIRYDLVRPGAAPVSPEPGPGVTEARERVKTQLDFLTQDVQFSADGRTVLAHAWNRPGLGLVDARTGAVQTVNTSGPLRPHNVVPLSGGRVGLRVTETQVLAVVSAETGKAVGTVPFTPFTQNTPNVPTAIRVSPDERYVAAGLSNPTRLDPDTKKPVHTPTAVRVFDTQANKTVVDFDWNNVGRGGRIAFSADSSRVLIVESTLRGRWYKLPSGEPDKTWAYADAADAPERFHIRDLSQNARVLLCDGTVDGWPRVFVLDAATGERTAMFAKALGVVSGIGLSHDGRRALLFHLKPGAKDRDFVVADTATGAEIARVPVPLEPETDVTGALSPDGRALVVFDRRKLAPLVVYDIPAGPGAGGAAVAEGPALAPPAVPAELKPKWSVDTGLKSGRAPTFTGDGRVITIATVNVIPWNIVSFNARTGAAGPELPKIGGNSAQPWTHDGPAIAYQADQGRAVVVWDTATEKTTRYPYPQPAGDPGFKPQVSAAPNGRYLTVAHHGASPDVQKERPLTPLQVFDTTTNQAVFNTDWRVGRTFFTADSSRLLVVDADDRFRWFHLPDGKLEAEWTFKNPANGFNAHVMDVADDGGVILFHGSPPNREQSFYLLDGKTGAVLHAFPAKRYHQGNGWLSDNGRFVAMVRNDGFGTGHSLEVLDARGNLFAVAKFAAKSSTTVGVSWKTRTVALYDRVAATLAAYDLPFDPNGVGAPVAAPPAAVAGDAVEAALAAEPPGLTAKWDSKLGDGKGFDQLLFAPDANAVLLGSSAGGFEALDPKSGVPRTVGFTVLGSAGVADFFALNDGRVGTLSPKAAELKVWDGKSGRLVVKYPLPAGGAAQEAFLAPNEKVAAVAPRVPRATDHPEMSLQAFEPGTQKGLFVAKWKGGDVHFAADSKRVLLAEWSGRCRWLALPSGAPDGEWDLGPAPADRPHSVTGASADGAVLGYSGPAAGKGSGSAVLDGRTGKPLRVFHRDHHPNSPVAVSADGRRAALVRQIDRSAITLDVVNLADGARLGRARIALPADTPAVPAAPLFALAPDGRALVVYEPTKRHAYLFEVPASPKAP